MSAFQDAMTRVLWLQAEEVAIEDEVALEAAICRTDDAFKALMELPNENILQAAAKLAALAAQYDVPGCGCDRAAWGQLVSDIVSFAGAETMKASA
jgi:hypothetical protein